MNSNWLYNRCWVIDAALNDEPSKKSMEMLNERVILYMYWPVAVYTQIKVSTWSMMNETVWMRSIQTNKKCNKHQSLNVLPFSLLILPFSLLANQHRKNHSSQLYHFRLIILNLYKIFCSITDLHSWNHIQTSSSICDYAGLWNFRSNNRWMLLH